MNSGTWIDSLARRARQEPMPEVRVLAPGLDTLRPRAAARAGPRPRVLWLSGAASLAAACAVLAVGLHAQRVTTTSSASSTAHDPVSVLFSPLESSTP